MGSYLRQHVSVVDPDEEEYQGESPKLHQHVGVLETLEPFTVGFCQTDGIVSVPLGWANEFYTPYEWKAAVYLTADHTPPVWYQLTLNVNSDLLERLQSGEAVHSSEPFLRRDRVATSRPVVGWVGEKI